MSPRRVAHRDRRAPVVLVRPGRTTLNVTGQLRGRLDPPLDSVGLDQATALARALACFRISGVLSSPLQCARQTAEPIAARGALRVEIDERLADRDYGEYAGIAVCEVVGRWGSVDGVPGVEPAEQVVERARAVLDDQRDRLMTGVVILVAHDAVNRLLMASLDSRFGPSSSIPQDPACWNILLPNGLNWRVIAVNQQLEPTSAE